MITNIPMEMGEPFMPLNILKWIYLITILIEMRPSMEVPFTIWAGPICRVVLWRKIVQRMAMGDLSFLVKEQRQRQIP
jgi:hypothetical protein